MCHVSPLRSDDHDAAAPSSIRVETLETNMIAVAVGYRRQLLSANGVMVSSFDSSTNLHGRSDVGVLFCVVTPPQLANYYFVLSRDELEGDTIPSWLRYKVGCFYLLPYRIKSSGNGKSSILNLQGLCTADLEIDAVNSNWVVRCYDHRQSNVRLLGDYILNFSERYYVSAEEAETELSTLYKNHDSLKQAYETCTNALRMAQIQEETLGVKRNGYDATDPNDAVAQYRAQLKKITPAYVAVKTEIKNAERQLRDIKSNRRKYQ